MIYNLLVSRYKCLLSYLSTTVTLLVDTYKWRLLCQQIINDNIIKHSNDVKYVLRGEVIIVGKYCTLIHTLKCHCKIKM